MYIPLYEYFHKYNFIFISRVYKKISYTKVPKLYHINISLIRIFSILLFVLDIPTDCVN